MKIEEKVHELSFLGAALFLLTSFVVSGIRGYSDAKNKRLFEFGSGFESARIPIDVGDTA